MSTASQIQVSYYQTRWPCFDAPFSVVNLRLRMMAPENGADNEDESIIMMAAHRPMADMFGNEEHVYLARLIPEDM